MCKNITLLILIILSLGACSTKPNNSTPVQKSFSPTLHANGSKRFVVAIVYSASPEQNTQGKHKRSDKQRGNKGSNKSGSRAGNNDAGRGKGQERSGPSEPQYGTIQNEAELEETKRKAILSLLNEKLDETGYCRHGFIELGYLQMRGRTELTGECQESASEADKQRWK